MSIEMVYSILSNFGFKENIPIPTYEELSKGIEKSSYTKNFNSKCPGFKGIDRGTRYSKDFCRYLGVTNSKHRCAILTLFIPLSIHYKMSMVEYFKNRLGYNKWYNIPSDMYKILTTDVDVELGDFLILFKKYQKKEYESFTINMISIQTENSETTVSNYQLSSGEIVINIANLNNIHFINYIEEKIVPKRNRIYEICEEYMNSKKKRMENKSIRDRVEGEIEQLQKLIRQNKELYNIAREQEKIDREIEDIKYLHLLEMKRLFIEEIESKKYIGEELDKLMMEHIKNESMLERYYKLNSKWEESIKKYGKLVRASEDIVEVVKSLEKAETRLLILLSKIY